MYIYSLLIFTLLSCSSIEYHSSRESSLTASVMSSKNGKKKYLVIEKLHEETLFGLFPEKAEYDISKIFNSYDISEIGNITIEQKMSFFDQLLMYFSFGIYIPSTITYSAWAKEKGFND